ncbi:MAG: hypothetical protein M3O09_02015 [Acidobacteriota bacterium]|nr:hypothetical protein [Acidobacteriota bacterium]
MRVNAELLEQQTKRDELGPQFPLEPDTPLSSFPLDFTRFGEDQTRSLVRQVFFQHSARAVRQVVFTAMQSDTDIAKICVLAGESLSAQAS